MPNLNHSKNLEMNEGYSARISTKELSPLQILQSDNECLRGLVVSLSASILRKVAQDFPRRHRETSPNPSAEHYFADAEECFVCAKISGLKSEIAEGLEAAGHDLMAKAVAIETQQQRKKWEK